jgi:hypothetical protein
MRHYVVTALSRVSGACAAASHVSAGSTRLALELVVQAQQRKPLPHAVVI